MATTDKAGNFQGFTAMMDPQAWCSLFRPVFEFQLGLVHSLWGAQDGETEQDVRKRLDGILLGLLEVAEPGSTPEELTAQRRMMGAYADIISTYAGMLREIAERMGEEPKSAPPTDF